MTVPSIAAPCGLVSRLLRLGGLPELLVSICQELPVGAAEGGCRLQEGVGFQAELDRLGKVALDILDPCHAMPDLGIARVDADGAFQGGFGLVWMAGGQLLAACFDEAGCRAGGFDWGLWRHWHGERGWQWRW